MAEIKIDGLRAFKSEEAKEPAAHEKAAEKLKQAARELYKEHSDIEVLRAELKDKIAECRDLKKSISKMQQTHEAELQDLKDQLGEAKAAEAAAKKAHAHAVGEKNNYADTLDNDSIAFEEIRALAIIMDCNAKSLQELAKMVRERTEV